MTDAEREKEIKRLDEKLKAALTQPPNNDKTPEDYLVSLIGSFIPRREYLDISDEDIKALELEEDSQELPSS